MKKFILVTTALLFTVTAAYAADEKLTAPSGMMQGDMMKNCQHHMKDGKMMDSMPKDMMGKCQEMMKSGDMMPQGTAKEEKPAETVKPADDTDHTKHHPAQ